MTGENFVRLKGKIVYPELKTVGANNSKLFKGKLAIPINGNDDKFQYVKIAAWESVAAGLGSLSSNTFIKVDGHIEERSYDGKCKHCNGMEKKYWTEVIIDNYVEEVE
jgi:hypothetical protein